MNLNFQSPQLLKKRVDDMYLLNKYEKAAIIGYWRSGATSEQISVITGFFFWQIEKVISEYQNKKWLR